MKFMGHISKGETKLIWINTVNTQQFLEFSFSEKATKICAILLMFVTFTVNGFLRKAELYHFLLIIHRLIISKELQVYQRIGTNFYIIFSIISWWKKGLSEND